MCVMFEHLAKLGQLWGPGVDICRVICTNMFEYTHMYECLYSLVCVPSVVYSLVNHVEEEFGWTFSGFLSWFVHSAYATHKSLMYAMEKVCVCVYV